MPSPPEGHSTRAPKRRAHGHENLKQPYGGRVYTDRQSREKRQLHASLEGQPGNTPAGNTLPHSYPENQVSDGEDTITEVLFLVKCRVIRVHGLNFGLVGDVQFTTHALDARSLKHSCYNKA